MSPEDWWGIAWVLSGIPFAVVCTADLRREGTWLGLLPGVSIGLMFGPFSLLLIGRTPDTQKCLIHMEPDVDHCRGCAADRKAAESA